MMAEHTAAITAVHHRSLPHVCFRLKLISYLGLIVGLLLVFIVSTGIVLSFDQTIAVWLIPALLIMHGVCPRPLNECTTAVRTPYQGMAGRHV
ncbi:MAG: hypothetical protein C4293_07535 [Nitrospiraceae bacterium]